MKKISNILFSFVLVALLAAGATPTLLHISFGDHDHTDHDHARKHSHHEQSFDHSHEKGNHPAHEHKVESFTYQPQWRSVQIDFELVELFSFDFSPIIIRAGIFDEFQILPAPIIGSTTPSRAPPHSV